MRIVAESFCQLLGDFASQFAIFRISKVVLLAVAVLIAAFRAVRRIMLGNGWRHHYCALWKMKKNTARVKQPNA
jgi:hypothetical protein